MAAAAASSADSVSGEEDLPDEISAEWASGKPAKWIKDEAIFCRRVGLDRPADPKILHSVRQELKSLRMVCESAGETLRGFFVLCNYNSSVDDDKALLNLKLKEFDGKIVDFIKVGDVERSRVLFRSVTTTHQKTVESQVGGWKGNRHYFSLEIVLSEKPGASPLAAASPDVDTEDDTEHDFGQGEAKLASHPRKNEFSLHCSTLPVPVAKLLVERGKGLVSIPRNCGTGFLLRSRGYGNTFLLTNNHVLQKDGALASSITVITSKGMQTIDQPRVARFLHCRGVDVDGIVLHPDAHYFDGVMALFDGQDPIEDVREVKPGDVVTCLGHPRGAQLRSSTGKVTECYPLDGIFRHSCATARGSSGSCIVVETDGRQALVGLHFRGGWAVSPKGVAADLLAPRLWILASDAARSLFSSIKSRTPAGWTVEESDEEEAELGWTHGVIESDGFDTYDTELEHSLQPGVTAFHLPFHAIGAPRSTLDDLSDSIATLWHFAVSQFASPDNDPKYTCEIALGCTQVMPAQPRVKVKRSASVVKVFKAVKP